MNKNFQGRFLLLSLMIIFFECLFLFFTIRENLNRPTVQDLAEVGLVQLAMAKNSEQRKEIFERSLKLGIYLWPQNRVSLKKKGTLSSKIDNVLQRDFGKEYKNLSLKEKKLIESSLK